MKVASYEKDIARIRDVNDGLERKTNWLGDKINTLQIYNSTLEVNVNSLLHFFIN